ncbi:TIGR04211 family SH3 domain-containing protein [Endothiovibrio diazotrophicus]
MRNRWTSLLILFLLLAPAAEAETLYVIDTLRVNVRQEPGRNAAPLGVVVTGMALEALERQDGYVRIRNEEGLEGWIKDDYLTTEKPAQLIRDEEAGRLSQLESELAQTREALDAARREKESALEELSRLQRQQGEVMAQESLPAARNGGGHPMTDVINGQPHFQLSTDTLPYWIGGILFIALLGFVSGISWYKNHVSRRLGGLRI